MFLIGTCGWSRLYEAVPHSRLRGKSVLEAYAEIFPAVELNSSFYRFHRVGTYLRWRRSTPEGFEFTVKCHRSITHEGSLNPREGLNGNMARMFEAVEACRARVLLLQMPASFRASVDSLKQMESLFERVEEDDVVIALETRGASWKTAEARRTLRDVFKRYHVAHVTDPMKLDPVWVGEVAYFRLHGLPSYSLKYSYTNSQLKDLRRRVEKFDDADRVYIFFNNYAMYRDAWRFQLLLGEGRLPPTPFGPSSVSWTLNAFDDWPVTKTELLERCGRWRCWVEPNRTVPLREILDHFESRIYRGIEEVNTEAQHVWEQTGQPEASEIEE